MWERSCGTIKRKFNFGVPLMRFPASALPILLDYRKKIVAGFDFDGDGRSDVQFSVLKAACGICSNLD
jgi:hypothetical protein